MTISIAVRSQSIKLTGANTEPKMVREEIVGHADADVGLKDEEAPFRDRSTIQGMYAPLFALMFQSHSFTDRIGFR